MDADVVAAAAAAVDDAIEAVVVVVEGSENWASALLVDARRC